MMIERLEEIKEHVKWTVENGLQPRVEDSDLEWLINRVEELEKEVERQKNRKYLKMRQRDDFMKQNQRYKQALKEIDDDMEHLLHYGFEGNDHLWRARKVIEQALKGE